MIELSLASSMFRHVDSDMGDLLKVVTFFQQGIDERNFGWLFPTVPDRRMVFDKFNYVGANPRPSFPLGPKIIFAALCNQGLFFQSAIGQD